MLQSASATTRPGPVPTSFGMLQLKHTFRPARGLSQQYSTVNVDYELAYIRGSFEGWAKAKYVDNGYAAGDLLGSIGWHYDRDWKDDLRAAS